MPSPKKISLEASDNLETIVKKIKASKSKEVIVSIPKNFIFGTSLDHFQLLKKKMGELDKKLFIESIDDHILDIAALVGIEAINPIFKTKSRPVSDIIPIKFPAKIQPSLVKGITEDDEEEDKNEDEDEDEDFEDNAKNLKQTDEDSENVLYEKEEKDIRVHRNNRIYSRANWRKAVIITGSSLALLGISLFVITNVLPRAMVTLVLKNYEVPIEENVRISKAVAKSEVVDDVILIPGEILTSTKNIEMSFPANGKGNIENKAEGKLLIFNAYSAMPQVLIASTRFESPDGKIFRLKERVVVPAATLIGGKLQPSSIEAGVVADVSGEAYNLGPIEKWTIPGFKDTPRYQGFYASSLQPMKGGTVSGQAVPTEADILSAKEKVKNVLLDSLRSEMAVLMSPKYEILEGTTSFKIKREEVYPPSGNETDFSLFAEAELNQLVFERDVLREKLIERGKERVVLEIDVKASRFTFEYKDAVPNLDNGEIALKAVGKAIFEPKINSDGLTAQILNKDSEVVKKIIFNLPGLERANVSFWPFWVKKIPGDPNRIELKLE